MKKKKQAPLTDEQVQAFIEKARQAGKELGETMDKVDQHFEEEEKRKNRPWWKKIFNWD
jgi:hypothetical protein